MKTISENILGSAPAPGAAIDALVVGMGGACKKSGRTITLVFGARAHRTAARTAALPRQNKLLKL
jgi:hypothetical protein